MRMAITACFCSLFPLGAPAQGAFYGPAIQADALANTPIGKSGLQVSYRFRANQDAAFQAIRPYLIWSFKKQGYHAGSGGTLKVELQTDNGSPAHLPSGQVLATNVQRMSIVAASDRFFPQLFFDKAPMLKAGTLYHLVFSNTDPDPEGNFVSVNALFNQAAGSPQQPRLAESDWAMLFRSRAKPAWVPRRTPGSEESFTPILEIDYGNGQCQGMGYIEFWMGAPKAISGPAAVREIFTVTGTARRVASVALRLRRLSGSTPLVVTLEQADGKALAQGRGDGSAVPTSASASLGGCAWISFALPSHPLLAPGTTYHLEFTCPGPARFEAFPMRKGSDKGFREATLFGDGHAEFNDGHGWAGWEQWGKRGLGNSDLQFYFVCLSPDPDTGPRPPGLSSKASRPRVLSKSPNDSYLIHYLEQPI